MRVLISIPEMRVINALLTVIRKTDSFFLLLKSKDFSVIHELLRSLLESGIISEEKFNELNLKLADLVLIEGKKFEERTREFARELEEIIGNFSMKSVIIRSLRSRDFSLVHEILENLLESGIISEEKFNELNLKLADLVLIEGKKFEERAREFANEILRYIK